MDRRRFLALLGAIPLTVPLLSSCGNGCEPNERRKNAPREPPEDEPPPKDDIVRAHDGRLWLDGERFRFLGVNVYSLLSGPRGSDMYQCGRRFTDGAVLRLLDELKAMRLNALRIAAYRPYTDAGKRCERLDLVMDAALERGIRVIPVFDSQWGHCAKNGFKYADWYREHYRRSYRDYVLRIVERYRSHPGVLAWQLMNEGQGRDELYIPDPGALQVFAADIGAAIRAIDPDHVISFGTEDATRFGLTDGEYERLHRSPYVDILETHDYGADGVALPYATAHAMRVAKALGKPFFIGEVGISSPPYDKRDRAYLIGRKIRAAMRSGADGALVWSYRAGDTHGKDFWNGDPLVAKLRAISNEFHIRRD